MRLKRIEGQIRGIQRMIEEDKYCIDILVQVAAARAALDKVGLAIFEGHTRNCLVEAIKEERGEETIEELMTLVMRFIK
ncbi:MAG: metal-sensitive transcriptional regulator [Firmicutes bacterium]|nr:metal-sensitive transcriptional regulator [Bacillota bacterium]